MSCQKLLNTKKSCIEKQYIITERLRLSLLFSQRLQFSYMSKYYTFCCFNFTNVHHVYYPVCGVQYH